MCGLRGPLGCAPGGLRGGTAALSSPRGAALRLGQARPPPAARHRPLAPVRYAPPRPIAASLAAVGGRPRWLPQRTAVAQAGQVHRCASSTAGLASPCSSGRFISPLVTRRIRSARAPLKLGRPKAAPNPAQARTSLGDRGGRSRSASITERRPGIELMGAKQARQPRARPCACVYFLSSTGPPEAVVLAVRDGQR